MRTALISLFVPALIAVQLHAGAAETRAAETRAAAPGAAEARVMDLVDRLHTCKALECDVVRELVAMGPAIWPTIQAGLAVERPEMTRFWVLGVLSDVVVVEARPILAALLSSDKTVRIRAAAAFALGSHKSPEVGPMLAVGLKDRDVNVRFESAAALTLSPSPLAVPALLKAIRDKDKDVRGAVLEALAISGDKRAVTPVLRRIQRDTVAEIRGRAAIALINLPGASAVAHELVPLLQSEKDEHALAALCFALGELREDSALVALKPLTTHSSEAVARHAAAAVKQLQAIKK